jgi:hypothetical protein
MHRFLFLIAYLMYFQSGLQAQEQATAKKIQVTGAVSLMNGTSEVGAQLSALAGVELSKGWTAGLGSAIDYYYFRSVPVFVEVKKYFGNGPRRLFAFGATGVNLAWPTDEDQMKLSRWNIVGGNDFRFGMYADIGIGYTLYNRHQRGLFTGLGYSVKTMSESHTEQIWNGLTTDQAQRKTDFTFSRVLIRIGYKF